MILCREIKNDEIFINYEISGAWKHCVKFDNIIPDNYENVSTIIYIHTNKLWLLDNKVFNDSDIIQNFMYELCENIGWSNLIDNEKQIIVDYNAYKNDTNKIIFLLGRGLTELEAKSYLAECWAINNDNLVYSLQQRFSIVKKELGKRIVKHDLEKLILDHEHLIYMFLSFGVFGLNYDSDCNGIMDYVENTHFYLLTGLRYSGYTFINPADNWDSIISMIKNILVYGNYTK